MMMDHYRQKQNMLISYDKKQAWFLLILTLLKAIVLYFGLFIFTTMERIAITKEAAKTVNLLKENMAL